jgi:hypothetical protein
MGLYGTERARVTEGEDRGLAKGRQSAMTRSPGLRADRGAPATGALSA